MKPYSKRTLLTLIMMPVPMMLLAPASFSQGNNQYQQKWPNPMTMAKPSGTGRNTPPPVSFTPNQPNKRDPNEFKWVAEKKFPDLPYFPNYPNGSFAYCTVAPKTPSGKTVHTITFNSKEEPQAALAWYQSTLKDWHWKVSDDKALRNNQVYGSKDGNQVSMWTTQATKPGFKCDLVVSFRQKGK